METILSIKDLSKTYKNKEDYAIQNINFDVHEGEFFCLLGTNGAGKSTIINIICTLLGKTSGEVTVAGNTLGTNDDQIRRSIGVVFQASVLDGRLTVYQNLMIRARAYGLSKTEATERISELDLKLGLATFINQRYESLSGGQKRKCDVARALLIRPRILFLDEPTTGLDPQSRIDLWQTIHMLREQENMTIFLTTHYMEETEDADRIAIIKDGDIIKIDTPSKLKQEFGSDTLRLIAKEGCKEQLEKSLQEYTIVGETYNISFKNGLDAISLLNQVKPYITSFELEKSNMDNVFLNIIGGDDNARI